MQVEDRNETICTNEPSNFLPSFPSNILRIYIYQPFIRIRSIKLNAYVPISILNNMYPPDSIYIFNGQVLDTQRSFVSYQITNGNKIVLLPSHVKNSNINYMEKWLKLTGDKENFEKRIELNIKQNSRMELARLKDLKFQKFELKRKRFNSYLKSRAIFQANPDSLNYFSNNEMNANDGIVLNTDFESDDSPSCEPLPVLW